MPVLTEIRERPAPPITAAPGRPEPERGSSPLRRALPVVAMVGGLGVMALAALIMVGSGDAERPSVDRLAITLSARDVSVVTQVYEPGENSGWHSHPGIHAVAVVSGVLTVVDGQCQPQTVEPGRPYVGGQEPHLVANRTDAPVTMAVTYLSPSNPAAPTEHVPAPRGCAPVA